MPAPYRLTAACVTEDGLPQVSVVDAAEVAAGRRTVADVSGPVVRQAILTGCQEGLTGPGVYRSGARSVAVELRVALLDEVDRFVDRAAGRVPVRLDRMDDPAVQNLVIHALWKVVHGLTIPTMRSTALIDITWQ